MVIVGSLISGAGAYVLGVLFTGCVRLLVISVVRKCVSPFWGG